MRKFLQRHWRRFLRWLVRIFVVRQAVQDATAKAPRLGPFETPDPRDLLVPQGQERFSPSEALHGAIASKALCETIDDAYWVETSDCAECIRCFSHGLSDAGAERVMVYFSGDVMLRDNVGRRFVTSHYTAHSPDSLRSDMKDWSHQAGIPAVFMARPGLYGSSGDHNLRRQLQEIDLLDHALNALKAKHDVGEFILVGHSAGGQIVAELLNRRDDVAAVSISSGLVSVDQVSRIWERRRKYPGWMLYDSDKFIDPVGNINPSEKNIHKRVYVISDPEDRAVPFFSQMFYVRRLRKNAYDPKHVYANARDPKRHLLVEHARLAAAMIARGRCDADIRRALLELDLDVPEKQNRGWPSD